MTTALMLLLGVVLTAGTFVFVSAEFSLVAVDQAVLDKKAEEGKKAEDDKKPEENKKPSETPKTP